MHTRTVIVGLLLALSACEPGRIGDEADEVDPDGVVMMAPPTEVDHFETLEDMVSRSTAVVDGEIISVEPGRRVGGERDWIQFDAATVLVHQVLSGDMPSETFVLEMEGQDSGGFRLEHSIGLHANEEGDRGVYFVWRKRDATIEPRYRLTSTQGRYLVAGDDQVLLAPRADDRLAAGLASLGQAQLHQAVRTVIRP